jgi:MHS family proline/betaine transporter-like MFS transporter
LLVAKKILKSPVSEVIRGSGKAMFITFCVGGFSSSVVYLVKTYINVFYNTVLKLGHSASLFYLFYASLVLMITTPLFGFVSDLAGKATMVVWSAISVIFLALPVLFFMSSENQLCQILSLTLLGSLAGAISGVSYIFVISMFKPEQRFSGVVVSYNSGIVVFGSTSPIISRFLVEITGLFYAPAFYIMTTGALLWIVMNRMKKYEIY